MNELIIVKGIIAYFFLIFSQDYFLFSFLLIGYIWLNKNVFSNALYILLTSTIINTALKVTYKVPLPSYLGDWYAFPSGHAQSSACLYLYLLFTYNNNRWQQLYNKRLKLYLTIFVPILLSAIGWGLVYFNYHDYIEVFAAIFASIAVIHTYILISDTFHNHKHLIIVVVNSVLLIYIYYVYEKLRVQTYESYYAILGFYVSSYFFDKYYTNVKIGKVYASLISFTPLFIMFIANHFKLMAGLPIYISTLPAMIVAFAIPLAQFIAVKITTDNKYKLL
jgi:membrane-associated phospholipid phosphatase